MPDDFDFLCHDEPDLETVVMPEARTLRRLSKSKEITMMKREHLKAAMPSPPEPGYTYHLISNGKYDFWTWIPTAIAWYGGCQELYGSTWTLNRQAAVELFELCDAGKIKKVSILTGLYFKRRETAVYATLLQGLQTRGFRYVSLENHAKITLIHSQDHYLSIEGSANWTANPRVEQYVITDDKAVYDFHVQWMENIFSAAGASSRKPAP
jgi:hypothetical protein